MKFLMWYINEWQPLKEHVLKNLIHCIISLLKYEMINDTPFSFPWFKITHYNTLFLLTEWDIKL